MIISGVNCVSSDIYKYSSRSVITQNTARGQNRQKPEPEVQAEDEEEKAENNKCTVPCYQGVLSKIFIYLIVS